MKKYFLLNFIILLILSMFYSNVFAQDGGVKPILDNKVLPGFHLHRLEQDEWEFDPTSYYDNEYKRMGVDIKALMNYKIKEIYEKWCTVSREEMKEELKKKGKQSYQIAYLDSEKWKNRITISITRDFLKDQAMAKMNAKIDIYKRKLEEGSIFNKKFGDFCWSNRSGFEKKRNYAFLIIVKNNIMVAIKFKGKELDPAFVEKISSIIVERL